MRIVAATTDEEMLHTIIGAQILGGTMDYRGFSNMKGFEQFRAACRAGDVQYSNLDYGFVEQTENLMLPDCAKEPQFEKAYRLLNLSDHEFNAIRNGSLESLGEDRTRLILDKALSWAAQNYAGWDLYRHLRDELGMSNEEIGKAGFDLDEFYEVEAADSAEYEVEADYREMPAGLTGIVDSVDDLGQIHCHWENGSSLALIPGVDHFHQDMTQEPVIESSEEQEPDLEL